MTRQQAINAFCKGCIYDPKQEGTWLKQVENCPSPKCALYLYRPVTRALKAEKSCISQAKKDALIKVREAKRNV